jgi:ADP-ribose pyrophosphatase YjhB (NUDIX family)
MPIRAIIARDGEEIAVRANDQDWIVSWHPPPTPPDGTPHGAEGVCVTRDGKIVLISHDGKYWGFPAGRPEGRETWEETLRREIREEACATVVQAKLLGFCRSACVEGPQVGLVLVRSLWRAEVELAPWEPQFEIPHRRIVVAAQFLDELAIAAHPLHPFAPIIKRELYEAAVT